MWEILRLMPKTSHFSLPSNFLQGRQKENLALPWKAWNLQRLLVKPQYRFMLWNGPIKRWRIPGLHYQRRQKHSCLQSEIKPAILCPLREQSGERNMQNVIFQGNSRRSPTAVFRTHQKDRPFNRHFARFPDSKQTPNWSHFKQVQKILSCLWDFARVLWKLFKPN